MHPRRQMACSSGREPCACTTRHLKLCIRSWLRFALPNQGFKRPREPFRLPKAVSERAKTRLPPCKSASRSRWKERQQLSSGPSSCENELPRRKVSWTLCQGNASVGPRECSQAHSCKHALCPIVPLPHFRLRILSLCQEPSMQRCLEWGRMKT